jgi:hypothetical protein
MDRAGQVVLPGRAGPGWVVASRGKRPGWSLAFRRSRQRAAGGARGGDGRSSVAGRAWPSLDSRGRCSVPCVGYGAWGPRRCGGGHRTDADVRVLPRGIGFSGYGRADGTRRGPRSAAVPAPRGSVVKTIIIEHVFCCQVQQRIRKPTNRAAGAGVLFARWGGVVCRAAAGGTRAQPGGRRWARRRGEDAAMLPRIRAHAGRAGWAPAMSCPQSSADRRHRHRDRPCSRGPPVGAVAWRGRGYAPPYSGACGSRGLGSRHVLPSKFCR